MDGPWEYLQIFPWPPYSRFWSPDGMPIEGQGFAADSGARAARSCPSVRDPPDRAVAVFGYEQRAVMRHGDADRPPPYFGIADHEASDEILVFARRDSVLETDPDHLVAGAFRPVP